MKKRILFSAIAVAALGGLAVHANNTHQNKVKADHVRWAEWCINVHNNDSVKGTTSSCEGVKTKYLSEDQKKQYAVAYAKHTQVQAKKAAEQKAANEKWRAEQKAKEAKRAEAKRQAEAKFKAEGWWQEQPGIYVRWCTDKNPCPYTKSYQDYTWKAMVWCKERACGDIYARLNISQNGTVVGWTNETAYGGYNQKVVLTFGSYTRGQGSIVEFSARG